jgi:anti-anti-sigma factor
VIQLSEDDRNGWRVVTVQGRADGECADELEAALRTAIGGNARVAADLAGLDYISSAGLRALLEAARAAQSKGAQFAICSPKPGVKRVFEISGLHRILQIQGALPC